MKKHQYTKLVIQIFNPENHRHIKLAIRLSFFALLLLFLSMCPIIYDKLSNTLQGLSTGLLSGTILLLITGIKNKEQEFIQIKYNTVHECRLFLADIMITAVSASRKKSFESIDDLYNKTFAIYYDYLNKSFKLRYSKIETLPEDIYSELDKYIDDSQNKIGDILDILRETQVLDDKIRHEVSDRFFNVFCSTFELHSKFRKLESDVYNQKQQINNSLI